MGDRALIQLTNKSGQVSPVLYLHWSGSDVADIIWRTQERMRDRVNDVEYSFARLVQEATRDDDEDTGFGCWNQAEPLTAKDSHGDAGCFLIDVTEQKWVVKAGGGYGFDSLDTSEFDVEKLD